MTVSGPIEGILVDFYGTISSGDREAVESSCRTIVETCGLPVTPEEFAIRWGERYFAVVGESSHGSFRSLFECEKISLGAMLAEYGHDRDPVPFLGELESYWADPPIYSDAVEFLRSIDLPVCCVSNADAKPLETAIRKHGLSFDAVICSEQVRCYKPEAHIFERALDALAIGPGRAVHIGDSLHSDVAGAAKLGITTVWLRRENRIHDIGICQPDYITHVLTELIALLSLPTRE